jgi:hypothetical protein
MLRQVKKLTLMGLTAEQVSDHIGVDYSTFKRWMQRFPDFRAVVLQTRIDADATVTKSLYKRAVGYRHKAVKIIYDPAKAKQTYTAKPTEDGDTEFIPDEMDPNAGVIKVDYTEYYPPDTAAAKFWLEQRQPSLFGQAAKLQLQGPEGGPVQTQVVDHLTFEQLMALKYGPQKQDTTDDVQD